MGNVDFRRPSKCEIRLFHDQCATVPLFFLLFFTKKSALWEMLIFGGHLNVKYGYSMVNARLYLCCCLFFKKSALWEMLIFGGHLNVKYSYSMVNARLYLCSSFFQKKVHYEKC